VNAFEFRLDVPFDEALERVGAALREQLGVHFREYVILGACNPKLAHRALSARPEVGLLLPCNVTLEKANGGVLGRIADPQEILGMGGFENDADVTAVAAEPRRLLLLAAESLARKR
jgi:uncharacterized protein (DUF302 family)